MKFKIGDRVKILSKATMVGVEREEVGKIGTISSISDEQTERYGFMIQMNEICKARGYVPVWSIGHEMFELLPTKGKQLLFSFMKEE